MNQSVSSLLRRVSAFNASGRTSDACCGVLVVRIAVAKSDSDMGIGLHESIGGFDVCGRRLSWILRLTLVCARIDASVDGRVGVVVIFRGLGNFYLLAGTEGTIGRHGIREIQKRCEIDKRRMIRRRKRLIEKRLIRKRLIRKRCIIMRR